MIKLTLLATTTLSFASQAHEILGKVYYPGDRAVDLGLICAAMCGVFAAMTWKEIRKCPCSWKRLGILRRLKGVTGRAVISARLSGLGFGSMRWLP